MARMKDLPPSEAEREAAQEEAQRKYAPYFGMFLEEIGNVSIQKSSSIIRKGGKEYPTIQISPRIRISDKDSNFINGIFQLFGGVTHIRTPRDSSVEHTWNVTGYKASTFAQKLKGHVPSHEKHIELVASWAFSNERESREELYQEFKNTSRSTASIEQYMLCLQDPLALAGAVDITKKIEKRDSPRENRLQLQTNNLALLTAIGNLYGLEPQVFAEAGKTIRLSNKEYTTQNATYLLDFPNAQKNELLRTIFPTRPQNIFIW